MINKIKSHKQISKINLTNLDIRCQLCNAMFGSLAELKTHLKGAHDLIMW